MKLGREIQFFLEFIFDFLKIPIETFYGMRKSLVSVITQIKLPGSLAIEFFLE